MIRNQSKRVFRLRDKLGVEGQGTQNIFVQAGIFKFSLFASLLPLFLSFWILFVVDFTTLCFVTVFYLIIL